MLSLVLTGDNTYTGGTTISGGTLQIGDGGSTGSILGDVVNNGVLAFDRDDEVTMAGAISGSGALAVGSEIMDSYGVDSYVGRVAAVMLGSSETTFYTVAVYYGAAGITKTRYTIPAALCADVVMFLASAFFVRLLMGA